MPQLRPGDSIADIHQRALVDPDPNNQKNYVVELAQSRQKNLVGLDPLAAIEINHDYNIAGIQLQNIARNNSLDENLF